MPKDDGLLQDAIGLIEYLREKSRRFGFLPEWINIRTGKMHGNVAIDDLGDTMPFVIWAGLALQGTKSLDKEEKASDIIDWASKLSRGAVERFQQDNGLFVTGWPSTSNERPRAGKYNLDKLSDCSLGLNLMGETLHDEWYFNSLAKFFDGLQKHAMYRNGYVAYQALPKLGIKIPFSSGKFCGLYAEEAARLSKHLPNGNYISLATKMLKPWIENKFALRTGLFPFVTPVPMARMFIEPAFRAYTHLPGNAVMTSKSNTNLIYGIIEAHHVTNDDNYKTVLLNWVDGMERHLRTEFGPWYMTWNPNSGRKRYVFLGTDHAVIDSMLEISVATKDKRPLQLAVDSMESWLDTQSELGLMPQGWKGQPVTFAPDIRYREWYQSRFDIQTDISVVLFKMAELTGKSRYRIKAREILDAARQHHRSGRAYTDYVDCRTGEHKSPEVETKFEFLFLKALLLAFSLSEGETIGGNDMIRSMIRDR